MAQTVEQKLDALAKKITDLSPKHRKILLYKAGILTAKGTYNKKFIAEDEVVKKPKVLSLDAKRQELSAWAKRNVIVYLDEIKSKLTELQFEQCVIDHFLNFREGLHPRQRWYEYEIMMELVKIELKIAS